MSIIFAAGKKSAAIVKGRDEEPRKLKSQTSNGSDSSQKDLPMVRSASHIMRSACVYKPSEDIIVWNPRIDGREQSIALRKSSMDIWFEDERLEYSTTIVGNTSRMDFLLMGRKAVIINHLKPGSRENLFHLQIEGEEIPQMVLPPESNN